MKTSNDVKNTRSNQLGWYLLAECALGEMMPDSGNKYEPTGGTLFPLFQELGVPHGLICKIELTLKRFGQQNRLERQGSFRFFCQKTVIDDSNLAKTYRPDPLEPMMELVPGKELYGPILNRGWGYFIIDRSRGEAPSTETPPPLVDLYLYQEGG